VLSVVKFNFQSITDWDKYEHLGIEVDDVEDENLLGEFERTGKWIETALREGKYGRKGKVLVHW
jgi:dual specificity phosphatase 12